jgi:Ureidoglycolate lyase
MNDTDTLPRHMLDIRELTAEAFAPYGQVVAPLRTSGQDAETSYDPEASAREAKLVLGNGEPRLWIMHLPHVGLDFTRIARHRRVTQCLGSLGGKEWLIGVAPPGDFDDDARPRVEDIAAFRVPGDRLDATGHALARVAHQRGCNEGADGKAINQQATGDQAGQAERQDRPPEHLVPIGAEVLRRFFEARRNPLDRGHDRQYHKRQEDVD